MSDLSGKNNNGLRMNSNPVLSRLSRIREMATAGDTATYQGIFTKTAYFLLLTLISILVYCGLNATVFAHGDIVFTVSGKDAASAVSYIRFAKAELITGAVCLLLTVVMPLVCAFSIKATPVCGSIYCLSEGYVLAMLIFKLLAMQNLPTSIGLVALLLTVLVIAAMAFLYMKRIVKVDQKFRTVLLSACGASILGGLLLFVLSLIPATRSWVASIAANPVLSIAAGAFSVVLAALFLLSDFAVIENCVESRMPVRYEWMASFGLAFTVIWLYLKILELLIRIFGNSKSSSNSSRV